MEFESTMNFMEGFIRYGAFTQDDKEKNSIATPVIEKKVAKKTNSGKYDADISALTAIYGTGVCIDIELQELLKICPRNRKRIEAYNGLVSELAKRGTVLTIKSRKTK